MRGVERYPEGVSPPDHGQLDLSVPSEVYWQWLGEVRPAIRHRVIPITEGTKNMAESHRVDRDGLRNWLISNSVDHMVNVLTPVIEKGIGLAEDNCNDLIEAAELLGGGVIVPNKVEYTVTVTLNAVPEQDYNIDTAISRGVEDLINNYDVDIQATDVYVQVSQGY